jgi:hypothetical protein
MAFTLEDFAKNLVDLGIDKEITDRLIEYYKEVKKAHLSNKCKDVIRYAGQFSEAILTLIENKVSGKSVNVDKVEFEKLYKKILNYPKLNAKDEILTLALPRVARSVYTLRNKKAVVHVKTVDPDFIDSVYCVTACDWMLSELAFLLLKADEREVYELINSVLRKKIPLIEEFEDGTIVVLKEGLPWADEILLALYHYYPQRLKKQELEKILKTSSSSIIYTYLQRLENKRLIHRTDEGSKLTQLGIKYVEENLLIKQENSEV